MLDIFKSFSILLDYPYTDVTSHAQSCAGLLAAIDPEAAVGLRNFASFSETVSPGRLEEIYTATFDINPACYIYAGYILFGETFKRGKFLVRLQEKYRERGFSYGRELADHVPVMLRFLAMLAPDDLLAAQLAHNCLLPVLDRMLDSFEEAAQNPYTGVLAATRLFLMQIPEPVAEGELS